jgi:hypothetical protein
MRTAPIPSTKVLVGGIENVVGAWRGCWSDTSPLNMGLNESGSSRLFWTDGTTIVRQQFSIESG